MQQQFRAQKILQSVKCPNNKSPKIVCIDCRCAKNNVFVCLDPECNCSKQNHHSCYCISYSFLVSEICDQKKKLTYQQDAIYKNLIGKYDQIMQKISKEKEKLIEKVYMFGLKDKTIEFIRTVQEGKSSEITNKLIRQVQLQLKSQSRVIFKHSENFINDNFNRINKTLNNLLKKISKFGLSNAIINSTIIKKDKDIRNFFKKKINRFELLYRGSENDFSDKIFHQKCDNIKDTVTIAQNNLNKIIGGYTPIQWKSSQQKVYKQDPSGQSFLFSLTLKEKYKLIHKQSAVLHNKNYGPVFGKQGDLCIFNNLYRYKNIGSDFPCSYNNGKYLKNKQALIAFSGSANRHSQLKQYEVFRIIWS